MGTTRGDEGMTHRGAVWFRCVIALLVRPRLWFTAWRQFGHTAPERWWTRPPFLPWPDRDYVRFRIETAYGVGGQPNPADFVRYLEWCRRAGS